jgi:ribosomal protein S18 acetylase RimI-like enzyme
MGLPENIHLRDATHEDQAFLEGLFLACHCDEFAPLGLGETQLEGLLRMQARAQRLGYAKDYPAGIDRIVVEGNEKGDTPIGRWFIDESSDAILLVDVALLPSARNAGIGTALLEELIVKAKRNQLPIRLSVSPGSRAFHLYSRLGFQVVSTGVSLQMEYRPDQQGVLADVAVDEKSDATLPGSEWHSLVGQRFAIIADTPFSLPSLSLVNFQRSARYARSFTLMFHGPAEPVLQQGTYPLRLEGAVEDESERFIFLVPLGLENGSMQYEAVFNC